MGRRSQNKGSSSPESRNRHGVMGGVIQFFDLRRMLSSRRHRSREDFSAYGGRRRRRSKEQAGEASSSTPRLTRTLSIHYLECNDYVQTDSEGIPPPKPTADVNSPVVERRKTQDEEFNNTRKELFFKLIHDEDNTCSNRLQENLRTKDVVEDVGVVVVDRKTEEEKKKEKHRISMDGFLHKIPYGQKISHEKPGFVGHGYDFKRSKSLTESVDRYSLLLDSSYSMSRESVNDHVLLPRSKSAREHGPFPAMNRSKTLGSTSFHSFRELMPYSSGEVIEFEEEAYEITGLVTIREESDTIDGKSEYIEQVSDHNSDIKENLEDEFTDDTIKFPKNSGFHPIHLRVESQDRSEFNYVRELLSKSGLNTTEEASPEPRWNSPDQPMDFAVFEELEGFKCKIDFGLYSPNINLDHLLLFDLINQVLLDTYSSYLSPWFRSRRLAAGASVLEEVWGKINWHRSHNPHLNNSIEHIRAREFSKDDGWADFGLDSEILGGEIEDLIFNDLLNEIIIVL